ncbi:MAG: metallophosphoesterase [Deltaproteobacteria bacterium]|nr:metallophosphoesterase [Deltaproteobacteria bacterium]
MTHDVYTLAHLSDLHVTSARVTNPLVLLNKRILGWLSWTLRRQHLYRPEVLQTLIADLHQQPHDSVVVTGDITNISLEEEFSAAVPWLRKIGTPEKVFIIPGNHDAYIPVSYERSWKHWEAYLQSDQGLWEPSTPTLSAQPERSVNEVEGQTAKAYLPFPTVRIREPVVLIGVNTTFPPAAWDAANGSVGAQQLQELEQLLQRFATTDLCRVVLIHHPPDEAVEARRRLTDTAAFCQVLRRAGAELVLHGHLHKTVRRSIPGPTHPIPVIGVRSSSAIGHRPKRRAQYHLYRIERNNNGQNGSRFHIRMIVRAYNHQAQCFVGKKELTLQTDGSFR